jgi:YHS domain-containing protein
MRTIKTLIATITLIGALAAGAQAFAVDEYNVSTGTNVSGLSVALRGNDAVALATGLEVTPGQAVLPVDHGGVAYYFAAEATMQRFAADPDCGSAFKKGPILKKLSY